MRRNKQHKARWEQESENKMSFKPKRLRRLTQALISTGPASAAGKGAKIGVGTHIPLLLKTGDERGLLAAPWQYQLTQMCRVVLRMFSLLWSSPQLTRHNGWCFLLQLS